jgi:hypothetical protein
MNLRAAAIVPCSLAHQNPANSEVDIPHRGPPPREVGHSRIQSALCFYQCELGTHVVILLGLLEPSSALLSTMQPFLPVANTRFKQWRFPRNRAMLRPVGILNQIFPPSRPRRRRAAAVGVGGFSLFAVAGVWLMRTATGKVEGLPCDSARDCKTDLICAEETEEGGGTGRAKVRGTGIKQCAKPCVSDATCSSGQSCEVAYAHALGPRGGKLKDKAKACLAAD